MSYRNMAIDAMTKCVGYDQSFPKPSEVAVQAWTEMFEYHRLDRADVLAGVAAVYRGLSSGVSVTPKLVCDAAREIRRTRMVTDEERLELAAPERITLVEWEKRHGERFPRMSLPTMPSEYEETLNESGINPLVVECGFCKAGVGSPCTVVGTGIVLTRLRGHPCRVEAASEAVQHT